MHEWSMLGRILAVFSLKQCGVCCYLMLAVACLTDRVRFLANLQNVDGGKFSN